MQKMTAMVVAVLVFGLLAGVLAPVMTVSATNLEDYVWTNGSLDNTFDVIGDITHDTERTLDGDGSTKVVFNPEAMGGRVRYSTADGQPVDLSGYNQVTLYLYVSNPEVVYGAGTLMLHRGDAVTEYDLRKVVEPDGSVSSEYAPGWNKITYDITGDSSLSKMYHIFVWFNWHQEKLDGAYFLVDNITFSYVENPVSKIENLGGWNADDAGKPPVVDDTPVEKPERDPSELSDTPIALLPETKDNLTQVAFNTWDGTKGNIYLAPGMIGDAFFMEKTEGAQADVYIKLESDLIEQLNAYNKITFWAYIDDAEALTNALNLLRFRYYEEVDGNVKELVLSDVSFSTIHDWVDGWNLITLNMDDFVITSSMTSHYKVGNPFPWDKLTDLIWLPRIAGNFVCAIDNIVAGSTVADGGLSFVAPTEEEIGFPEVIVQGATIQLPEITSDASLMQILVTCDDLTVDVVDNQFVAEDVGTYVIKVVLSDEFNRSIAYSKTYTIDAKPPKINFIKYFDENNTVELGTVVELSKITIADGVDPNPTATYKVTLNGADVAISDALTFTVDQAGTYTVLVTATDASGNVAEQILIFTAETGADNAEQPNGDQTIVYVVIAVVIVAVALIVVVVVLKKKNSK